MKLEIVEADITRLDVDAIANAANDELWMGSGVAGAIKRAGGDEIEAEALAKGPIAVGDAVATGAGSLPAKWVVHGAVMGQDLQTTTEIVGRTTRRCLEVADELGARSLALPAFGTGVGGRAVGGAPPARAGAGAAWEPTTLERAIVVVYGGDAKQAFEAALA